MNIEFPVSFAKMSGTGNDFIVIDHRRPLIPDTSDQAEFVKKVCRRMFSVGADGVIFIEHSETADFSWRFYNGDGSVAEMCGNGARCAARFAYARGIAGKTMKFETLAGVIEAEILDNEEVSLLMTPPEDYRKGLLVELDGKEQSVDFMNSGVPHTVLFMDSDADIAVKEWGKQVRFHELFQPAGTNVNFVQALEGGGIRVRTYERGVEDETMACGTGAVASAIFAAERGVCSSPVSVTTSGGEQLKIVFDLQEDGHAENVYLQGPARIIYIGQLTAEALQ